MTHATNGLIHMISAIGDFIAKVPSTGASKLTVIGKLPQTDGNLKA